MTNILHKTFDQGNYHKLHVLLQLKVNVDIQDPGGRSLLMKASWIPKISEGQALVNALIKRGADRTTADKRGWTALFHAVYNNRIGIAKSLLEELDLDLQHRDIEGLTVLHLAALQGHTELARGLVSIHKKCHVHVDLVDNQGMTALHTACARGHYDLAKILVYKGEATQTKRDNVYFRSPEEWLQVALGLPSNLDLFPPKTQKYTRDWDVYTATRFTKPEREPLKTAPCLTIPKPEQIRLALSPIENTRQTKPRCKSAQISRSREEFDRIPVKSKTFMLTCPSLQPERTSTAKDEGQRRQRLKSAPPKLNRTRICNPKCVTLKSSMPDLNTSEQQMDDNRSSSIQEKPTLTPKQVLRHIYDAYTLQVSSSYRREAIPPPPPLSLSDLNNSILSLSESFSARPISADRKSCSSGKARFQKVVRMRRAESILKSLKGIHGKRNSLSGSVTSVNEIAE